MSKVVAIIQARMSSSRLPGKVLMDIEGKPMLEHIIDRLKDVSYLRTIGRTKNAYNIVVATTENPLDRNIVNLAIKNKVKVFVGSEYDVLDRFYQAATSYTRTGTLPKIIMRITSDCPLIDPQVIDKVIGCFDDFDYMSNVGTFPDGLDTEVFSYKALKQAWEEAASDYDREHVTPYIINHTNLFRIGNLKCSSNLSHYHWSVNTIEGLEFVRWVYSKLGDKFYLEDILKLLEGQK